MKKVCFLGSSHINYLKKFDTLKSYKLEGEDVKFIYHGYSGKNFKFFLSNPCHIDNALRCKPDYLIVLVGGNSITLDTVTKDLLLECRQFYELVSDKLKAVNPNAKLIPHQIPLRFIREPDNSDPNNLDLNNLDLNDPNTNLISHRKPQRFNRKRNIHRVPPPEKFAEIPIKKPSA